MFKTFFHVLFHPTRDDHDRINLRRWFIFFTGYLILLAAFCLVSLSFYERTGGSGLQRMWLLGLYLFYMSLCCTFFPGPTAWIVLLMASPIVALIEPQFFTKYYDISDSSASLLGGIATVIIVATVGAAGTTLANLNEYHIFTFLLRFGKASKVRQTRLYKTLNRYFVAGPFVLMVTVSLLPIPVDIVRWLAISNRYRRDHYGIAYFLGRFVRYGVMAAASTSLKLSWQSIIIIQLGLIAIIGLSYLPRLLKTHRRIDEPTKTSVD